jgi:glycerophosphoryl diester phosphodiesterase
MGYSWLDVPHKPLVLGHRGARHAHPENTLRAFQAALDEGAVGTEFDVQLSSDRVPVVFHDFDLRRMTGGRDQRHVHALRARELSEVVLDGNERIPELRAVLDWAVTNGALLNIELKSRRPLLDPVADVVSTLLQEYPTAPEFALVSSFHPTLVRRFARRNPRIVTALLVDEPHPCLVSRPWLTACHARAVHPKARLLLERPELMYRVAGTLINTWTVNDEAQAVALAKTDVTGIITDRPGAILEALAAAGYAQR